MRFAVAGIGAGSDALCAVEVTLFHGSASSDWGRRADILSDVERDRAARFHHEKDRTHFLAAHILLRESLARYLHLPAVNLVIAASGKPLLDSGHGLPDVHFSLSHSGDEAAVAICRGCEVGIDIETRRENFDAFELAQACMTQSERDVITRRSNRNHDIFLEFWTAKEAILKATGQGLSVSPQSLELTRTESGAFNLMSSGDERIAALGWKLAPIRTATLTGAIAARCASLQVMPMHGP